MTGYYSDLLSGERLKKCYELAPARTRQYLEAEIQHVLDNISPDDAVLELGCGYGRVLRRIKARSASLAGIDTSFHSLKMARKDAGLAEAFLAQMNAGKMAFASGSFDVVVCIQNGLSAFKLDPKELLLEALRVMRPGGLCLFSTYAERFWESRLEWFEIQAKAGLLGEIDWNLTKNGKIICKDGFSATTFTVDDFVGLREELALQATITEVDESSLFLQVTASD